MKGRNRYLDQDELRRLADEPSKGLRMEFYIVSRMDCSSSAAAGSKKIRLSLGFGVSLERTYIASQAA